MDIVAIAELIYSVNPLKDSDPDTGEEWYVPFDDIQSDYPATMEALTERAVEVASVANADLIEALRNLKQTILDDNTAICDTLWMSDDILKGCTAVDYIDLTLEAVQS